MSFNEIVEKTYCPFAKPSKMGPPLTVATADVEARLRGHREAIAAFFRDARQHEYDGMVITFEDESLGATLESLALLTKRFFLTLAEMYPSVYIPQEPGPDQKWYATIEGERFFLVSFAPCYPGDSPRHTYGDQRTYFLLQPGSTFGRNAATIERLRNRISRSFEKAGKPYDARLANVENDMFKIVMPISPIDQHIPWWEAEKA